MNQQQQFESLLLEVYQKKSQNSKLMNDSDYSELLQRIKRIRETGPRIILLSSTKLTKQDWLVYILTDELVIMDY